MCFVLCYFILFFVFKQKTAYEMRISDWSSDVCSPDLNSDSSTISRPAAFPFKIQGGMLEALGINMYATIGKCLVEFVANAFDSEATTVDIVIPKIGRAHV